MPAQFVHGFDGQNDVIWVEGLDVHNTLDVAEDARKIVPVVLEIYGRGYPIIYRDTMGVWDQLEHNGTSFLKFRSLGGTTDYNTACERV